MYDNDNIFAKILREELPCTKVYEDEMVLAFKDINPVAPIHILVIPKGSYISFHDFINNAKDNVINHFFKKVREIADNLGLGSEGYRICANHGENSGQIVPHFHLHILGGKRLGSLLVK